MPYNDYKFKKGNKSMKNIYLKYTLLSVAMTSSLLFTACGHKHTFADATCTTPKTCTECNEIEGDALGHTWLDATCENPMTCSVCNLTDGDVLEHSWLEATTEAPKTCEFCGHSVAITDNSIKENTSGVDSTGSDVTIPEGEYVEPSVSVEDSSTQSSNPTISKARQEMKEMYESGQISKKVYDDAMAVLDKKENTSMTEVLKEEGVIQQSTYSDPYIAEIERNAAAARAEMSTGNSADLSEEIDYSGPASDNLAGYRIN